MPKVGSRHFSYTKKGREASTKLDSYFNKYRLNAGKAEAPLSKREIENRLRVKI